MSGSPREAIEATLGLIAEELGSEGFALKPGLVLRRKLGNQGHAFHCQSSKWNRGGELAVFQLGAWFESDRLSSWRKARRPGRPAEVTKFDRVAATLQLKVPDSPHHAEWDAVDAARRPEVAREAAAIIRAQALPWFELMGDPVAALRASEVIPNLASVIQYAVATGHSDAARERVASLEQSNVHFAEILETVRANGKPAAYRNAYEPIAWAAVDCGIA